jgi:hypothetical protein
MNMTMRMLVVLFVVMLMAVFVVMRMRVSMGVCGLVLVSMGVVMPMSVVKLVLMSVGMGVCGLVLVSMGVVMPMSVVKFVLVLVGMGVDLPVLIGVIILFVCVDGTSVNAEFHAFHLLALGAFEVHVKIAQFELRKLPFECGWLDAQITEGADRHIAADA